MPKILINAAAITAAVLAVVAVAVASVAFRTHATPAAGPARTSIAAATAAQASVAYPQTLPAGYGSITGLAASASGDDAWYLAESRTRDTLFRYSAATRQLRAYQLPVSVALRAGLYTPIAIEGADQAWIGINSSLVHVDGATGQVTVTRLAPPAIASAARLPVIPAGAGYTASAFEGIQSMSMTANGTLYIARLFASALQAYNTATGKTSSVALPAGSVIEGVGSDLAVGAGGAVTAVLARPATGQVAIAADTAGAWREVATPGCAAQAVAPGAAGPMLVGPSCAATVTTATAKALATQNSRLTGTGVALSATTEVLGTTTGAILVQGGAVTAVSLGHASAAGLTLPPNAPVKSATTAPITFALTAGADASHVWFVPATGAGRQIGLLTIG